LIVNTFEILYLSRWKIATAETDRVRSLE